MSTNPPVPADGVGVPFASLAELRAAHLRLLKGYREAGGPAAVADARAFLRNGRASGALLSDTEERWSAQSILDYWATTLYQHGQPPLEATLADFDPQQAPLLADEDCPYVGLDTFLERDHDRFFGRSQLVAELIEHLRRRRMLVITGPSGSGKSSLALAGLMAELRRGALPGSAGWRYFPRTVPGSSPLASLARIVQPARRPGETPLANEGWVADQVAALRADSRHLARLISQAGDQPVTLIVDQFEEVFTLCDDTVDRSRFIGNLLYLALMPGAQHRVIFTMRSDFESYLLQFPKIEPHFRATTVRLLPLNAGELREAIERPAESVGLRFESGIVDALIQDILGEPAALPLLQFTLFKLWESRERNRVTWERYRRLGGGRVALATSADEFYRGLLPEEQQTLKRILLRMVRPGEGLEVTSSRVRRELFFQAGEDPGRVERVLDKLMRERLIRVTEGATPADTQVEVAHEALVRNWPLLVEWVDEAREQLRQRYRLTRDAEDWNARGRDPTLLLGETRLREAQQIAGLGRLEHDFVAASRAALEQQRAAAEQARREREQALQRDLEQQLNLAFEREQRANERARHAEQQLRVNRRLRGLALGLAAATVLAVSLAGLAFYYWLQANQRAEEARLLAMIAEVRNAPSSDYGLIWADALFESGAIDAGVKEALDANLEEMLHEALQRHRPSFEVQPVADRPRPDIRAIALSPNGTRLLTVNADGLARIYAAERDGAGWRDTQVQLSHPEGPISGAAWSPDGRLVATTGGGAERGLITLWEAEGGARRQEITTDQPVGPVAWGPDGQELATASGALAELWSVVSGQRVAAFAAHTQEIRAIAWSPDRTAPRLLTAGDDGTIRIWTTTGGPPEVIERQSGSGPSSLSFQRVTSAAWSPDGRYILAGLNDGRAQVWEAAGRSLIATLVGHNDAITGVAWAPDQRSLLTGSADGSARAWKLDGDGEARPTTWRVLRGGDEAVSAVAWSPDGAGLTALAASGSRLFQYRLDDPALLQAAVDGVVDPIPPYVRSQALVQLAEKVAPVGAEAFLDELADEAERAAAAPYELAGGPTAEPSAAPPAPTLGDTGPSPTPAVPVETATAVAAAQTSAAAAEATLAAIPSALPAGETAVPPPPTAPPPTAPPQSGQGLPGDFPPPPGPAEAALQASLDGWFSEVGGRFSVLAYQLDEGRTLYSRSPNDTFYAASLIKLPIAMAAYDMAARGEISLEEELTLEREDKVPGTGNLQGAPDGSRYPISELARLMLRDSDNTASNMLLERIGFERVNSYMARLGAASTIVERRFFDDAAREAGRDIRTSPRDMAILLQVLFSDQVPRSGELRDAMLNNTDSYLKIRAGVDADTPVWNKSGVLSRMEHDAALIRLPDGKRLIVVMMSEDVANQRAIDAIAFATREIYDRALGRR